MMMKTNKIQANFARKREIEQLSIEKKAAVGKYFDTWGKLTSRYERWDTPEFYRPSEERMKLDQEQQAKSDAEKKKREEWRLTYEKEKEDFYRKLNEPKRPKAKLPIATETLAGINETFKRSEEEKRRLQLESNLYKKLRLGTTEENILLNSKSDHQALAKLNWLDRQVAAQIEREQLQKQSQERQLRLHEEARRNNELLNSRKLLRNEEIGQLKAMQQNHMDELKAREKEGDELRGQNSRLQQKRADIQEELANLTQQIRKRSGSEAAASFNSRRIKMQLRQRSEAVRSDLRYAVDVLNRLGVNGRCDPKNIDLLREKFEMQYDLEIQKQGQFDAMYESEAKVALAKQQEVWAKDTQAREALLKGLIGDHMEYIDSAITHNDKRQKELDDIRETHRQAVDGTIERIKDLTQEQKADDFQVVLDVDSQKTNATRATNKEADDSALNTMNTVVNAMDRASIGDGATRPKFGRKKIAWT